MDKKITIKKIKSPKTNISNKSPVSQKYKDFITQDISKIKKKNGEKIIQVSRKKKYHLLKKIFAILMI